MKFKAKEQLVERTTDKHIIVANDYADLGVSYYKPFAEFAPQADPDFLFSHPDKILCVVFTGGADVDPSVYGDERNPKTSSIPHRDKAERRFFDFALEHKIPMAGICRGAQLLCALSGGKLVQHIDGHGGSHTVRTFEGVVTVTSTHHQMQLPPKEAKLLAWTEPRRSRCYEGGMTRQGRLQMIDPEFEYEGVYYPNTNSLGMQWHPEIMRESSDGWQFTQMLIAKLLSGRLGSVKGR